MLTAAALRAAALLGLKDADLAIVVGTSTVRISRYKNGTSWINPASQVGRRALLLIRLFRCLTALTGADDGELRRAWMHGRNEALDGVPATLIVHPGGLVRTLAYLEGMMTGVELAGRRHSPAPRT